PMGHEASSFDRENIPALVFASRATSSFPGAFNPMQFKEIDRLLVERRLTWRTRADFLFQNFRPYLMNDLNPSDAAFIDGSVLNNKPFALAIAAIGGRPAFRHVDRRLLYIDPHPQGAENRNWGRVPGFFETIKGALSDIPRNEPVHDDLAWVNAYNRDIRRMQTVIDSARLHIRAIADAIAGQELDGKIDVGMLAKFRDQANNRARLETGFAYEGYLRLKLTAVIEEVARLVVESCGHSRDSKNAVRIAQVIQHWATTSGVVPPSNELLKPYEPGSGQITPWVRFLLRFDLGYRQRRVRFVLRAVNQFYTRLKDPNLAGLKPEQLDRIKAGLYDALGFLQPIATHAPAGAEGRHGALSHTTVEKLKAIDRMLCNGDTVDVKAVEQNAAMIDDSLSAVGADMALETFNTRTDTLLISLIDGGEGPPLPQPVRRAVIEHYIGFAVWDVLTFSVTNWRDLDEFDEIRVDRVSPNDSQMLRKGGASATLKGVQFYHFGAFFSLQYRQNDYLWGRLHAAERLIDIVIDAARLEDADGDVDIAAIKKAALGAILDEEEKHLSGCQDLIAELRRDLAAL
ncbi:MAG: patatin-like protein, partial [Rhodobacteraceae bacterium]|nr:patatin-like protein [Paracoccaceae bacterium]